MMLLSDAIEYRLQSYLPEFRLEILKQLKPQLRSGRLTLRDVPKAVRDLFGKGWFTPLELNALEALLERKVSDPLPKKNSNIPFSGIPPPSTESQATDVAA